MTILTHYYSRKADIFNRGYSGYNSNHGLAMMRTHIARGIWPTTHAGSSAKAQASQPETIVTLFFGANDSCLPGSISDFQAVPLDTYRSNLRAMVELLKGADGKQNPHVHLILVGPPQVDGAAWGATCQNKYKLPSPPITRDLAHTATYAEASKSLATELQLPYINTWSFTSDTASMLEDGLHLSERGNHKLFKVVNLVIQQHFPTLTSDKLPVDSFPFLQIRDLSAQALQDLFDQRAKQNDADKAAAAAAGAGAASKPQ